ncbi:MAG: hypothetical protein Q4D70_08520, partial [bacterium]|nr:hypothetical protein [bacterium]
MQFNGRHIHLPAEARIGERAVVAHCPNAVHRQHAADGERVDAVGGERRPARPIAGTRRSEAILDAAQRHLQTARRILDEKPVSDFPAEVPESVVALVPAAEEGGRCAHAVTLGQRAPRQVSEQPQEKRIARLLARHEGRAEADGRIEDAPPARAALDDGVRSAVVAE